MRWCALASCGSTASIPRNWRSSWTKA
jgi:hypothetical protein